MDRYVVNREFVQSLRIVPVSLYLVLQEKVSRQLCKKR